MKIEYRYTERGRAARIDLPGVLLSGIDILQDSSWVTGTLEAPQIGWPSPGGVSIAQAKDFADGIKAAIKIASRWEKDTGKHPSKMRREKPATEQQ